MDLCALRSPACAQGACRLHGFKAMPETKKTCQVIMHDGKPCGRELYDDEFCIFHSKKEDKDEYLFHEKFNEIFKNQSLEIYDFTHFIFLGGVAFPLKFPKSVIFRNALFYGEADFEDVGFERTADFLGARFEDTVDFRGARFLDAADFTSVTCECEADFGGVRFTGGADFRDATFVGKALFMEATFQGRTEFSHALFKARADFGCTIFEDWASFYGATFGHETYFGDATFQGDADFWGAIFQDTLRISAEAHEKKGFLGEVSFGSVEFFKPEKVIFQKVDLSRFRFLETDLRGVHFIDVNWNKEDNKGPNRVFDEVSPSDNADLPGVREFDHALIAQLYRRLRANYEENLRYSEAGDFYIGEMEMTRKAQTSIFKKLPLLFYKAISNYGESYYRPLGWIAVILLTFPLLFMFAGIQPVSLDSNNPTGDVINYKLDFSSSQSLLPTSEKIGDYYTSFLYSMSVFSFIRDKKYTTIDNWGHTLFVLESILSPVTLAFFLLALRRRFKR